MVDSGRASEASTVSWGARSCPLLAAARTGEPVQTLATHLKLMTKNMAATTTGRGKEDQRGQGQEISPGLDIEICNNVSQRRNETPGPSVPSSLGNRRTHTRVTDKDTPDTRGSTSEMAGRHRSGGGARDESTKTGRAATVEAQAQNTLADLASTKPLTAKPTDRDITGELPSQVSDNMRTHGAERSPTKRLR